MSRQQEKNEASSRDVNCALNRGFAHAGDRDCFVSRNSLEEMGVFSSRGDGGAFGEVSGDREPVRIWDSFCDFVFAFALTVDPDQARRPAVPFGTASTNRKAPCEFG